MSARRDTGGHIARVSRTDATGFAWGSIQWLVSRELAEGADITFGYVEIEPGCKNPRHLHPNCDEVLYVLEGTLEHSIGDSVVELGPGAALLIPRNMAHDARNPAQVRARVVVAYSTGERQTVQLEDSQDDGSPK
jgi:quercetin dioxygenase-like cupin family protein